MRVREARPSDLPAVVEILNQAIVAEATAHTSPATVTSRQEWFDRHDPERRPILVAELGDQVVGWLSLGEYRPGRGATRHTAEITYYVDQNNRRRGVASALVTESLARCPVLSIQTLVAILLQDNEASVRLLEKFGFREWGQLPGVADFGGRVVGHLYYGLSLP